jgi:hypothetical protein
MIGYINVLDKIEAQLLQDPFCKAVSRGDIYKIATNKQQMYPLSHIMVNSFRPVGYAIRYNISVISMDLVQEDESNEEYVKNTQSFVNLRLIEVAKRGTLHTDLYQLVEDSDSYELFTDRFEDKVAGCVVTFDVLIPNEMPSR